MNMKVAITGGHLTTALAVIDELKKIENTEIIFLGRASSLEGDKYPSAESMVIPNLGIKFIAIKTGRLQRKFTIGTILSLLKAPIGFLQSLAIISKEKPDIIVSFGSYVALPVAFAGWVLGIPTITHEQTVKGGLANRLISKFAKKIAISWEQSKKYFPDGKTVLVGNPVRKEILEIKKERTSRPLIYITGGSQGSHSINEIVGDVLPQLLSRYEIIHQTGGSDVYKDYEKLKASVNQLPRRLQNRYKIAKWFNTTELSKIFAKMDILVGRSGANTVSEVASLGIPAIFIPLPWAGQNEQFENAKILEDEGAAIILSQERLTPKRLLNNIDFIVKNYPEFKKKAKKSKKLIRKDAAANLVKEIKQVVNNNVS